MKIFYLITKSEAGGAQTHIYQLCRYFIKKREEVAVMAYPGGWLEFEVKKMGARFYPNRYLSNSPNPVKALKVIKEIKKAIHNFKPDLIACHSTMAGILGRMAIRNKIPTIFTVHGWAFTEGVGACQKVFAVAAERLAAKYCSKIICVSEFDKNLALKYKIVPSDKMVVIHNGVEIQDFERIEHSGTQIVFVGRLAEQKDPLLLLKAFNGLPTDLKDRAQILIIGEGPKRKELERFIKENQLIKKVSLLGNVSREKVFEIFKKSDIFVLTSNWEGFPYTILEAMSVGLPAIASDVGGVKEALDEHCGILVKRGDEKGLREALEKLLQDPSLIKKMGENVRKRTEEKFSLEKMLRETEAVYEEVLFASARSHRQ